MLHGFFNSGVPHVFLRRCVSVSTAVLLQGLTGWPMCRIFVKLYRRFRNGLGGVHCNWKHGACVARILCSNSYTVLDSWQMSQGSCHRGFSVISSVITTHGFQCLRQLQLHIGQPQSSIACFLRRLRFSESAWNGPRNGRPYHVWFRGEGPGPAGCVAPVAV